MAVTRKSQQKATNKYIKNHYDRLNITLPKGQRDIIAKVAAKHGKSVNSFVRRLINEALSKENLD